MSNSTQEANSPRFVTDSDPRFLLLRSDVRDSARVAELKYREDIRKVLSDNLAPDVFEALSLLITTLPEIFIRGSFEWLFGYSNLLDQSEALAEDIRRAQQSNLN